MASGYVQVPPDSTGKKVDCTSISSGAVRQVVTVGDPTVSSGLATVTGGKLNVNASVGGTVTVAGNVSATIIGSLPNINISAMPNVTIGSIPNINVSAMPAVSLAAGATLDGISKTVSVVVTNAINISSMPAISVGPISTIDKISATVLCVITQAINISSMPAISVGPISTIDKISATVLVAGSVTIASGAIDISSMPKVTVSGTALVAGAVTITSGAIDISSMPAVTIGAFNAKVALSATPSVVLAAGTANFGTLNNISATVAAVLAAGTANIGTINNISATVAAVLAAGTANIGTINNISAAVVLAAGANNIGTINGISATVTVVNSYPRAVASASHGPKTVTLSSSAGVALVAAPGAATSIYVTQLIVTNGSASLTRVDIYEASATATPVIAQYAAANGGGFTITFDPPYKVSANTALNARLKPSASQVLVTPNFYVGA